MTPPFTPFTPRTEFYCVHLSIPGEQVVRCHWNKLCLVRNVTFDQ